MARLVKWDESGQLAPPRVFAKPGSSLPRRTSQLPSTPQEKTYSSPQDYFAQRSAEADVRERLLAGPMAGGSIQKQLDAQNAPPLSRQEQADKLLAGPMAGGAPIESVGKPRVVGSNPNRQQQRAERIAGLNDLMATKTRTLTPEEFDALSTQQQAAVMFNTAALDAKAKDKTGAALSTLLGELGLDPEAGLSNLTSNELLGQLGNTQARAQSADSLRWARGAEGGAPQAQALQDALSGASRGADAMSRALASGRTGITGSTPLAQLGFGTTEADGIVQYAFNGLANADEQVSLQQVADFLAESNATSGTNVTLQDVFNFANLRLQAADFAETGNNSFILALDPGVNSKTAAQLRAELGIQE